MSEHSREDRIIDAIENWHIKPDLWHGSEELHEYLGWTYDEYKHWFETNEPPPEREGAA